jgi:alpha-glucosidase (family GH31 glycosyl hydrolase)
MKKGVAFILLAGLVQAVAGNVLETALEPGECWWGGHVSDGMLMPFTAGKEYSTTLIGQNFGNYCGGGNQSSSVLVSSKGRYVWSDQPFAFAFKSGRLTAEGGAALELSAAPEKTLRGAFLAVSQKHFPASGRMPDEKLFAAPQWNTWIELTYNQNQADILKYAASVLAHGFDPGVLMIDDTWQTAYGVWKFEPTRFPDPKAMCEKLHAMGFKIMLWVCPYVSADSWEFRNELQKQGGLLMDAGRKGRPALFEWWNGYSACVDLSSPAGMGWFKAQLTRLQRDYGVDGFKFDAGDACLYRTEKFTAHDPAAATPEMQSKLFGTVGLDYPLNEYRAMWQMGGQPLAERLRDKSHVWPDIRQCVADMLAQGVEGYTFNCPDMIGGGQWTSFQPGMKMDFKLIVRSAQVHALMPMMQFSLNPWRVMTKPEDQKYLAAISKAAAIRRQFTPKILALARESAKTGEPIVRCLEYVFPGQGFEDVRDEFVLGDGLIVAPVVAENDERPVRLPAGNWRGDDGQAYKGPAAFVIHAAALDRIPRFELEK